MTQIGSSPNLIGSGVDKYASFSATSTTDSDNMKSRLTSIGKEFEGVFLSLMLKEMRNTLEGGGFFGEESSDTYGGMFDMFIGQDLAESSPLGIVEMLVDSYLKFESASLTQPSDALKSSVAAASYGSTANQATNAISQSNSYTI